MKMINLRVVAALIMAASFAQADEFTWVGAGTDDNWQTPQNWSSAQMPDSDGTAVDYER